MTQTDLGAASQAKDTKTGECLESLSDCSNLTNLGIGLEAERKAAETTALEALYW